MKQEEKNPVPPSRLWVQLYTHTISATELDPREVHDNGKPVYQYVLAESHDALRKAAEMMLKAFNLPEDGSLDSRHLESYFRKPVAALRKALKGE